MRIGVESCDTKSACELDWLNFTDDTGKRWVLMFSWKQKHTVEVLKLHVTPIILPA